MTDEQICKMTQSDTALMLTRFSTLHAIIPLTCTELAETPSHTIRRSSLHPSPHSLLHPTPWFVHAITIYFCQHNVLVRKSNQRSDYSSEVHVYCWGMWPLQLEVTAKLQPCPMRPSILDWISLNRKGAFS